MKKKKIKTEICWFGFIVPALLFYLLFFVSPAVSSAYYSLTEWDGVNSSFIGLDNYKKLIHDREILTAFGNTIFYTVGIVVFQNILGLLFAIAFKRKCVRNNILRTLIFMPYVFSSLLIGFVFKFIFEPNIGALNSILRTVHLESLIRPWLTEPFTAKCIIIFVTVWQCLGYTMVINIAGLQGISEEYYEASSIDGATKWQQFLHITIPLLAPATTINIMLSLIGDLQIFNQIYALTGGGPAYQTESVATTIYRLGFGSGGARWGYGAAMSVMMFLIMLVFTVTVTTYLRKREVDI